MFFKNTPLVFASTLFALLSFNVQSTIVVIKTSLGPVEVNLFDNTTPETVANFMSYVDSGAYANNVVHRSVSGFIVQAGGFQYTGPITGSFALDNVAAGPPVVNEPNFSNLRGTIAMAKLGNQANSATSGWFINLANNSVNLDAQNSGFTVFGQVTAEGMQVMDAIANISVFNAGGAFSNLPIRNYTQSDVDNNVPITNENLVVISDIEVTDRATDTAANLDPAVNTLMNSSGPNGDSGGGAINLLHLFCLIFLTKNRLISKKC